MQSVSLPLVQDLKMIHFNIEDWPYDILQTPGSPKCLLLTLRDLTVRERNPVSL